MDVVVTDIVSSPVECSMSGVSGAASGFVEVVFFSVNVQGRRGDSFFSDPSYEIPAPS